VSALFFSFSQHTDDVLLCCNEEFCSVPNTEKGCVNIYGKHNSAECVIAQTSSMGLLNLASHHLPGEYVMKTIRTLAALIATGAVLGGCASSSPDPYYGYNNGYNNGGYRDGYNTSYRDSAAAGYGTIESIQVTNGDGRTSGAGAIVGGVVGALAGNQVGSGSGRTAATVAGGVAGAAIGNNVERNREGQQMYAVNVRLDNGEYRTIMQDSVYDLRVGNRVRVVDGRVYRY
jgi:outer membrane lipoprotein SlyB